MPSLSSTDGRRLGRTLALGSATYTCLVLLLRGSGKRPLSKMNAFDLPSP